MPGIANACEELMRRFFSCLIGYLRELDSRYAWVWTLLFVAVVVYRCDGSGGGIAGAGWDSKKTRAELDAFKPYMSPELTESVTDDCACNCPDKSNRGVSQHFDDIFRSFDFSVENLYGDPVAIPSLGLSASYAGNEFTLQKNDQFIVHDVLPDAFGGREAQLGVGKLGGRPVIMIRNRSRATTGRSFVAIYDPDGTVLYRKVLIGRQVWDIEPTPQGISILGGCEARTITVRVGR